MSSQTQEYISIGILGLLIALPTFFPLHPGQPYPNWYEPSFLVSVILICTGLIFSVISGFLRKKFIAFNLADVCFIILTTYIVANTWLQNTVTNSTWVNILWIFLLFFVTRILGAGITKKKLPLLFTAILLVGVFQVFYALFQSSGKVNNYSIFNLTGSFFNPGPLGGFLATIMPISMGMILNSRLDNYSNFRINNILAWLFITFGTLVLFFTFSRAGIIAALSGTLLVIWPYIEKRIPLKISKKGLYTLLSTIAISAIIGLYLLKKDSADGRLFVWKVSSSLIGDAPFFGHGWGSFDDKYNLYQAQYFDSGQGNSDEKYLSINGVKYPYNESIKWIVENGVVGFGLLILFLVLLYLSFQKVLFSERNNALQFRSILGSLVALFIFSQFSYPSELIFLSVFGPVLLALLGVGETINQKTLLRGNGVIQYGMVTLLLASGFYLGKWTINNRKYAGNWEKAFAAFNEQKYHEANQLYSNSYHQLNDEANFLQQYGKSLSLSSQFDKSNIIMTRAKLYSSDPGIYNTLGYNYFEQGKYQKAELELLQSMSISPYSLYPQYILSKSYFRSNQTDKAVYRAKILLSIEPKIHNDMSNSIRAEMTSFINENK